MIIPAFPPTTLTTAPVRRPGAAKKRVGGATNAVGYVVVICSLSNATAPGLTNEQYDRFLFFVVSLGHFFPPQCGVPKKGHVCPYQPKLKRRPDEPLPETRNAAVQVEMDEFMTIRRLNLKIQGLPESYVSEPYETLSPASHHPSSSDHHSIDLPPHHHSPPV
jgi:hypothetical protein